MFAPKLTTRTCRVPIKSNCQTDWRFDDRQIWCSLFAVMRAKKNHNKHSTPPSSCPHFLLKFAHRALKFMFIIFYDYFNWVLTPYLIAAHFPWLAKVSCQSEPEPARQRNMCQPRENAKGRRILDRLLRRLRTRRAEYIWQQRGRKHW